MKIFHIRCRIDGIYFWGDGWKDTETQLRWYDYLDRIWDSVFWKVARDTQAAYLFNVNGGGMVHPMDGVNLILKESSCKVYHYVDGQKVEHLYEIDDLKKQLEDLAEHCGGLVKDWEVNQYEID